MSDLVNLTYRSAAEAADLRAKVRHALVKVGAADDCVEIALVLLSELTSNALRHADTETPLVRVGYMDGDVRISVTDAGRQTPVIPPLQPGRVGGNGLRIIDRLADAWGVVIHDGLGKTVWCTVRV